MREKEWHEWTWIDKDKILLRSPNWCLCRLEHVCCNQNCAGRAGQLTRRVEVILKFTQPLNFCWSEQIHERKEHWIWIMFMQRVRSVSLIEPRVKSTQSSFLTLQSHFEFYFDLLCDLLSNQWAAVEHLSIWINLRSKQNQSPSSHLSCVIEVRLLITWSRAFNCSPCEPFFLFIGWDQLCLSCSWGVHSRTITRMKEFEIQPRIVDTVFTPGFWKMTKDWKCLQDDNKFHHGRQRAYCEGAGLSPPPTQCNAFVL